MLFNKLQKILDKTFKSISKFRMLTKLLIIFIILLFICIIRNRFQNNIENFDDKDKFIIKYGDNIYDNYYVNNYELIFLNEKRNKYLIDQLFKDNKITKILEISCKTGYNVNMLNEKYDVLGIDKSSAMINYAKENYPNSNFKTIDILKINTTDYDKFSHILCINRSIYEIKNKSKFFDICIDLLDYNGYLYIDLVDRDSFKPFIIRNENKILHDPEKYNNEIKKIIIKLDNDNEFVSKYQLSNDENNNNEPYITYLQEFKNFKTKKIRKNELYLYIPEKNDIINIAKNKGFTIEKIIDMKPIGYKNEYLYIFKKTM